MPSGSLRPTIETQMDPDEGKAVDSTRRFSGSFWLSCQGPSHPKKDGGIEGVGSLCSFFGWAWEGRSSEYYILYTVYIYYIVYCIIYYVTVYIYMHMFIYVYIMICTYLYYVYIYVCTAIRFIYCNIFKLNMFHVIFFHKFGLDLSRTNIWWPFLLPLCRAAWSTFSVLSLLKSLYHYLIGENLFKCWTSLNYILLETFQSSLYPDNQGLGSICAPELLAAKLVLNVGNQ